MSHATFYQQLATLPLFQGLSGNELQEVAGHTKFGFAKVEKGKAIVSENDHCSHLWFLLNGQATMETHADDHHYTICEQVLPPAILQPERLFGLTQRYSCNFLAASDCQLMSIDKQEVMRLSDRHLIFRLNLLNIISARAQKQTRQPWRRQPQKVADRIIRFFEQHCMRPAGEKTIFIRMSDLAAEVYTTRLQVSQSLNKMQSAGLLSLSRGKILIPQLERLLGR